MAATPLGERVIWEGSPSLKAMLAAILGVALFGIVLALVTALGFAPAVRAVGGLDADVERFLAENLAGLRFAVGAGVAAVIGWRVVRLLWRILVLKSHRYKVTNQRLQVESGVFSKGLEELDMRTVEDLTFRQGLLERILGVGQIVVISSDRSAGHLRLLGIERPREVRELIRESAYAATRGQLFTRTT
jgi:membrane protein YdbS with pleckstrin-like domain